MYLLINVYPEEASALVSKHKRSTANESGIERKVYFIKRIADYKCNYNNSNYVSRYIQYNVLRKITATQLLSINTDQTPCT